jgi:prepilin-type N-terminal cleavage/methylation domain-containing protein
MQIKTSRKSGFTLVEIMIVVAIIGLLAAIAIPNFVRAREQAQLQSIVNNLRIIEGAKDQWALENKEGTGATATTDDLKAYMQNGKWVTPVVKETYAVNVIGTPATASATVPLGTYAAGATISLP